MKTLVAVVGSGNFGLRHAGVLREIGAVPVLVPVRAARVPKLRAQGWEAEPSLAMARARGARRCVIATDTGRHAVDAALALRLGMDVLIEKPIAADAAQARLIAAAARSTRRKAYTAYVLRFDESLLALRRLLPRLGAVHGIDSQCRAYLPDWPGRDWRRSYRARAAEGGALRDLSHELDYVVWLFGAPRSVHAVMSRGRLGLASDESAYLIWRTPDGATAAVGVDYLTRPQRRALIIRGERGTLEWDGIASTVTLRPARGRAKTWGFPADPMARLAAQDRAFLRGGRGLATLAEGARVVALIDAARRSSKTGRAEKVRT